jgi:hypothetical protein
VRGQSPALEFSVFFSQNLDARPQFTRYLAGQPKYILRRIEAGNPLKNSPLRPQRPHPPKKFHYFLPKALPMTYI